MARLKTTPLFARAGDCFDCIVERVADFVVESCGGPLYFSQRHARLQAGAGLPLLLDEEGGSCGSCICGMHSTTSACRARCARISGAGRNRCRCNCSPHARHDRLTRYSYDTVQSWFAMPPAQPDPPGRDRTGAR
jgi:hypothetical protein